MLNDFTFEYETLVEKSGSSAMEIKRLKLIALETFKSLDDEKDIFLKDVTYK